MDEAPEQQGPYAGRSHQSLVEEIQALAKENESIMAAVERGVASLEEARKDASVHVMVANQLRQAALEALTCGAQLIAVVRVRELKDGDRNGYPEKGQPTKLFDRFEAAIEQLREAIRRQAALLAARGAGAAAVANQGGK